MIHRICWGGQSWLWLILKNHHQLSFFTPSIFLGFLISSLPDIVLFSWPMPLSGKHQTLSSLHLFPPRNYSRLNCIWAETEKLFLIPGFHSSSFYIWNCGVEGWITKNDNLVLFLFSPLPSVHPHICEVFPGYLCHRFCSLPHFWPSYFFSFFIASWISPLSLWFPFAWWGLF